MLDRGRSGSGFAVQKSTTIVNCSAQKAHDLRIFRVSTASVMANCPKPAKEMVPNLCPAAYLWCREIMSSLWLTVRACRKIMTKLIGLLLLLAMIVQIIKPIGLPGLKLRADFWKLAVLAFVLWAITLLARDFT